MLKVNYLVLLQRLSRTVLRNGKYICKICFREVESTVLAERLN